MSQQARDLKYFLTELQALNEKLREATDPERYTLEKCLSITAETQEAKNKLTEEFMKFFWSQPGDKRKEIVRAVTKLGVFQD